MMYYSFLAYGLVKIRCPKGWFLFDEEAERVLLFTHQDLPLTDSAKLMEWC